MIEIKAPSIQGFESFHFLKERSSFSLWRAKQQAGSSLLDVLILIAHPDADKSEIASLLSIYKHIKTVNYPSVIKVYEIHEDVASPYIVAEYVNGRNLYDIVKKYGTISDKNALRVAKQLAEALRALGTHKNFVLRNLKPDSLKLDSAGNIKICDYYLAVLPDSNEHRTSLDGTVVGTPQYISPEQAIGVADIDFRSDIYSLGAVLYYLITGIIPFDGNNVFEILDKHQKAVLPNPQLFSQKTSSGLVYFISRLMLKNRSYRYSDWDDLLADISRIESGQYPKLIVPPNAVSSVSVQNCKSEEDERDQKIKSAPAPGKYAGKSSLCGVQNKPASESKRSPVVARISAFLWVLLVLWFFLYSNYLLNNIAKLPEIKVIDKICRTVSDKIGLITSRKSDVVPKVPEQIAVTAKPPTDYHFTAEESKTEYQIPDKDRSSSDESGDNASYTTESDENAESTEKKSVSETEQTPDFTWAAPVIARIMDGKIDDAAKLAGASGSADGMNMAVLLKKMPNLNDLTVTEIMKHKGNEISLVYMGKERTVIPVTAEGTSVIMSFNGRSIKIDITKLTEAEKLPLLKDVSKPEDHLAAIILALELDNNDAVTHHALALSLPKDIFIK